MVYAGSMSRVQFVSCFVRNRPHQRQQRQVPRRLYQGTSILHLNRFLFDSIEVNDHDQQFNSSHVNTVILSKDDYRTVHAAKILGLQNGDTVRAGVVSCEEHDGLLTDQAEIEWLPEGKVKKAEPLGNGNPPGSLCFRLNKLTAPPTGEHPRVSLILALPRPLQLGRMLPMISQMGVDHLILTRAKKVPKDYFGSHLFRKPEVVREKLIEGLCQAGDVRLPQIHIVKNLYGFLDNEMDEIFPRDQYARVIAHPQRPNDPNAPIRIGQVKFPTSSSPSRIVVAVGPEGGWEEPNELDRFQECGFQQITLGARTLRSDCAVISLLSLAHEACAE